MERNMSFNPELHHRRSIRLRGYDYSTGGAYFVTICAWQRECLFGEVVDGALRLNEAGHLVTATWESLSERFQTVLLDQHIVMPNHFHGTLVLSGLGAASSATLGLGAASSAPTSGLGAASSAPTLGNVVRAFKSISAISINRALDRQGIPLWQRNYYERVIRNEQELTAIRQYIVENPARWNDDENHPARV
jgi:REP element-mobilizing transposase RayT